MKPEISIIVPAYNCEKYIKNTLNSLVSQSFSNIQIICIDDCSTDKTASIIENFANSNRNIVFVKLSKNQGVAHARNVGLKQALGKFIMFCDGDDIYDTNMCKFMHDSMIKNNIDIAIAQIKLVYTNNDHPSLKNNDLAYYKLKHRGIQPISNMLILDTDLSVCNKIFKKETIDKYDISFPDGLLYEDAYFSLAYFFVSRNALFMNKALYSYIRHQNSIMDSTFSHNTNAIDHIKIAFKLYHFLQKNVPFKFFKNIYPLILFRCYAFALRFSPAKKYQKIFNECKNFINENELFSKFGNNKFIAEIHRCGLYAPLSFHQKIFSIRNSLNKKFKRITVLGIQITIYKK